MPKNLLGKFDEVEKVRTYLLLQIQLGKKLLRSNDIDGLHRVLNNIELAVK